MRYLKTYENNNKKGLVVLGSLYKTLFITNNDNERTWANRYDDIDSIEFIKKLFEDKEIDFLCIQCVGGDYNNIKYHRIQGVVKKVEFDYTFVPPEVSFITEDSDIKHVVSATEKIIIEDYKINDLEIKLQYHKDAEKFGI